MTKCRPQVHVILPFDKSSAPVVELIFAAFNMAGVDGTIKTLDSADGPYDIGLKAAIQSASLLIADVTNASPNVMYEVGFGLAHNKPLLLLANHGRSIPFALAGHRALIYDLAKTSDFAKHLAESILLALEQPEKFVISDTTTERDKHRSVFISYSHCDREYVDRLLIHLRPLEMEGAIDLWVDTRLRAGDKWKKEIEKALENASAAILVISADFLASDFIIDNELPSLLKNAEERGTRIIPLIVKPCRFARDKTLRHFQAINDPKQTLALLPHAEQEILYDQVANEVENWLQMVLH